MCLGYLRRRLGLLALGFVRHMAPICFSRKRLAACLMTMCAGVFTVILIHTASTQLPREVVMEQQLSSMQAHLQYLETLYRGRQQEILVLQAKVYGQENGGEQTPAASRTIPPNTEDLMKNITGLQAAAGFKPKIYQLFQTTFVYQLLPHLLNNADSLQPAYHMSGGRSFVEVVMGIPTVKRDKESYLMVTLTHLVRGLSQEDHNTTLIVVMIGETDLHYVVKTADEIEKLFPKEVGTGLIEVIAPAASYYPDFDTLPQTLGDSAKRVKWRTKQNLDTIYLMAYAQSKGTFYLMLEDDVIANKNYMQSIKMFASMIEPTWFFIEFCKIGGIGKLFKSSELTHFIIYVQLFFNNMPIDWLLESYLADKVCSIDKSAITCAKSKQKIRPRYSTSLFQHIGLYSSLRGKIQKVHANTYGTMPPFFPHKNPPVAWVKNDIKESSSGHSLQRAYEGTTFFWGNNPLKDNVIEFHYKPPVHIAGFTFRSGNVNHFSDRFYNTIIEVLPTGASNYTQVGMFDEFGLAEGTVDEKLRPIKAIRLRVLENSYYWCILSEIELVLKDKNR